LLFCFQNIPWLSLFLSFGIRKTCEVSFAVGFLFCGDGCYQVLFEIPSVFHNSQRRWFRDFLDLRTWIFSSMFFFWKPVFMTCQDHGDS
jgi:hypothetical protein